MVNVDKRTEFSGIVLAGGLSSRLGRDKAGELLEGTTLLERALEVLLAICREVLVVTASVPTDYSIADSSKAQLVADIYPHRGPLGGLYTGLKLSSSRYNIAVACDMPFLNGQLLGHLVDMAAGHDAVVPLVQGRPQTLHAVYSKGCLPVMEQLMKDSKNAGLRDLLKLIRVRSVSEEDVVQWDGELLSFFNVNTSADLKKAQDA